MPHLRLEYTPNLPDTLANRELFARFHKILAQHGVLLGNCKSRARAVDNYMVGAGKPDEAFVHLEVRMLEGRGPEAKRQIGEQLVEALRSVYVPVHPEIQITVELFEIDRSDYFKHPPGTLGKP